MNDELRYTARYTGQREEPWPELVIDRDMAGGRLELPPRTRVRFGRVKLRGVDLSGQRIDMFTACGTLFDECDFTRTRIAGLLSHKPQAIYRRCRFIRTRLEDARPGQARFEACLFEHAAIDKVHWMSSELVGCRFVGRISECIFSGTPEPPWDGNDLQPARRRNEFHDNDFSAAELLDCSFRGGIDLAGQHLPEGERYVLLDRAPDRIARVRQRLKDWPVQEDRMGLNNILDHYDDFGQTDLFLARPDPSRLGSDLGNTLIDLLQQAD